MQHTNTNAKDTKKKFLNFNDKLSKFNNSYVSGKASLSFWHVPPIVSF